VLLDQAGAQPAHRRIAGDAGADNAAADDQRVERLLLQLLAARFHTGWLIDGSSHTYSRQKKRPHGLTAGPCSTNYFESDLLKRLRVRNRFPPAAIIAWGNLFSQATFSPGA
jgi:hypothetical protein